ASNVRYGAPQRPREYAATPSDMDKVTGPEAYRTWKENESGVSARQKTREEDGTYKEIDTVLGAFRRFRYEGDRITLVAERTNAGHLLERTSDTLRIVGRETRFMGLAADAR